MVRMAERKPHIGMARRRTNHGEHIGRTRSRSHPRLAVEPLGERKKIARDWLGTTELNRCADRVAPRELRPRGEADATAHRRKKVAALSVQHGQIQTRLSRWAVVHVIAALDREGQMVAKRARQDVGPRSK